jgi:hypothetical protein
MSSIIRNTRQSIGSTGWVFGWVLGLGLLGLIVPVAQADDADHLIIGEFLVKTRSPVSTFGSPFIEVTNPTAGDIDMGQVYITDATTSPSAFYYNIALMDPEASNPGGGNGGDFHAKFPTGFVLGAGQSLVISLNGSTEYFTAYGRQPDFELFEDATVPDAVPELEEAFPNSINAGPLGGVNVPVLSDVAESIVLYQWDRSSDLVQDLDYVLWGSNTAVRVDKTGVTVGAGTYQDDTPVAEQSPVAGAGPTFGHSFQRVSADEGAEVLTGGNGVGGHDETSENCATTWADVTPADPATGLPVAFPSAPIVTNLMASGGDDSDLIFLASVLTFGTMDSVEFYYSIEGGEFQMVAGSDAGGGQWTATAPGPGQGADVTLYCRAANADGGAATYPVAAPDFGTVGYRVKTGPQKLLITEVSTGPNIYSQVPFTGMEQLAAEFIEVHNPNSFAVDMSDYYLTDAINYNFSTQLYWYIAEGNPSQDTVGGGNYNDFVARFPDRFTIEPLQTITISMAGSSWFEWFFGQSPDLEMYEEGAVADTIPDMRPVFQNPADDLPGNSIYTAGRTTGSDQLPRGIPELEEHYGEPLILYHYAQGADLVTDVDVFMWGDSKTGDYRIGFDKTGETNGDSAYADDTPVADQVWYAAVDETGTKSYTRIDGEESTQTQDAGNGVAGRDETSENWSEAFAVLPFSPGVFIAGQGGTQLRMEIHIPAATFNPEMGERFPIEILAQSGNQTRLRIFDREGRLVVSLWDSRADGPVSAFPQYPTTINWDGRDENFERVRAGLYYIHLSVVDLQTGNEAIKTAPVVVATRLSN